MALTTVAIAANMPMMGRMDRIAGVNPVVMTAATTAIADETNEAVAKNKIPKPTNANPKAVNAVPAAPKAIIEPRTFLPTFSIFVIAARACDTTLATVIPNCSNS